MDHSAATHKQLEMMLPVKKETMLHRSLTLKILKDIKIVSWIKNLKKQKKQKTYILLNGWIWPIVDIHWEEYAFSSQCKFLLCAIQWSNYNSKASQHSSPSQLKIFLSVILYPALIVFVTDLNISLANPWQLSFNTDKLKSHMCI